MAVHDGGGGEAGEGVAEPAGEWGAPVCEAANGGGAFDEKASAGLAFGLVGA